MTPMGYPCHTLPSLDKDQTNIDGPRQSQSQSQIFHQGPDCLVSGPGKMARHQTKLNFPNTNVGTRALSTPGCAIYVGLSRL